MTNREFDAFLRTRAGQEAFSLAEPVENRIRQTIQAHTAARRVKPFPLRTALIAAIVLVLLAATALAVSNLPGVVELMERIGWGMSNERLEHIQEQTVQPQGQTFELSDVTFTLGEAIYDGNRLYATVRVAPKENANVVLLSFDGSPSDCYGVSAEAAFSGTAPREAQTIAEAANERKARILMVDVFVNAPRSGTDSLSSMDCTPNPDGSFDFVFELDRVTADENSCIPVELFGRQAQLTDEGVTIGGTEMERQWSLSVPALVDPLTTPAANVPHQPSLMKAQGKPAQQGLSSPTLADQMTPPVPEPTHQPSSTTAQDKPVQQGLSGSVPTNSLTTPVPEPTHQPSPTEPQNVVLRVLGSEDTRLTAAYKAAYPDNSLVFVDLPEEDGRQLAQTDWDVACLTTDSKLFAQWMESGALYDLSDSEALSAWAACMHQPIRQAISRGSALYAVPLDLWPSYNGSYLFTRELRFSEQNPWKQLGFTDEDMPETADELFSLIEKYAALPKKSRQSTVFSCNAYHARSWLLDLVMELYAAQTDGTPSTFQTDELRGLLSRMEQAAAALKGEGEIGFAVLEEGGLLQGAEHAMPLRLWENSPNRVYALMNVLVVNPNSPQRSQAVAFAETMVKAVGWEAQAVLDSQVSFEELNELALEQEMVKVQEFAAFFQSEAEHAPDEITRKEALENADAQLASMDYIQLRAAQEGVLSATYSIYAEDLQAYRERLAPLLTFRQSAIHSLFDDGAAYSALANRYLTGEINADTFLNGLDALLAHPTH